MASLSRRKCSRTCVSVSSLCGQLWVPWVSAAYCRSPGSIRERPCGRCGLVFEAALEFAILDEHAQTSESLHAFRGVASAVRIVVGDTEPKVVRGEAHVGQQTLDVACEPRVLQEARGHVDPHCERLATGIPLLSLLCPVARRLQQPHLDYRGESHTGGDGHKFDSLQQPVVWMHPVKPCAESSDDADIGIQPRF